MATRYLVKIQGLDEDLDFTGSFDVIEPGEVPRSRVEWLLRRVRESPAARNPRECPATLEVESVLGRMLRFQGEEGYLYLDSDEYQGRRDVSLTEAIFHITGSGPEGEQFFLDTNPFGVKPPEPAPPPAAEDEPEEPEAPEEPEPEPAPATPEPPAPLPVSAAPDPASAPPTASPTAPRARKALPASTDSEPPAPPEPAPAPLPSEEAPLEPKRTRERSHLVTLPRPLPHWRPGWLGRLLGLLAVVACGFATWRIIQESPPQAWRSWRDAPLPVEVEPPPSPPPPVPEAATSLPDPPGSPAGTPTPTQPVVAEVGGSPTTPEAEPLAMQITHLPEVYEVGSEMVLEVRFSGGSGKVRLNLFGSFLETERQLDLVGPGPHRIPLEVPTSLGPAYLKVKAESGDEKVFEQFPVTVLAPFVAKIEGCGEGTVGSSCTFRITLTGGSPPYWGSVRSPGSRVELPFSDRQMAEGTVQLPETPGEIELTAAMLDGRDHTASDRALVRVLPVPPPPPPPPPPTPPVATTPPEHPNLARCRELQQERQEVDLNSSLGRRDSLGDLPTNLEELARRSPASEWESLGCQELLAPEPEKGGAP